LPVPHGGLLVQNRHVLQDLAKLELKACGLASISGRITELFLERFRSRHAQAGRMLSKLKTGAGRSMSYFGINRIPVGDMGFDLTQVDVAMSGFCRDLLPRFDYQAIHEKRRGNYFLLRDRLAGKVRLLNRNLDTGVCPLFFPILVNDKHEVARILRRQHISAVEFWNYGDAESDRQKNTDAAFLRRHVLELPIHQDITPEQIEYMAERLLRISAHISSNAMQPGYR
jgi:hypothetical protein